MVLMDVNSFLQYFPRLALGFFLFLALPMSWTVITLLNCLYWNLILPYIAAIIVNIVLRKTNCVLQLRNKLLL